MIAGSFPSGVGAGGPRGSGARSHRADSTHGAGADPTSTACASAGIGPRAGTSRRRTLLVVDDDRLLCQAVGDSLRSDAMQVVAAHTAAEALRACSAGAVDVVVLDQKLPDAEGHSLCKAILEANETTRIVFVTGFPSFDNALQALKAGAHDYLCKPFELEELALVVERCLTVQDLERAERLQRYRSAKDRDEAVLVGALERVREVVALAAPFDAPVLVTGETGTGKNLVAKSIHFGGPRRQGPFITVNCAALPEQLIEAELFGWERGSFTGAVGAREGVIEMAEGGTLFLDEIGEMPLHLQAKLLAIIEEKETKRLGGRVTRPVDARVVAATNVDLESLVASGRFRSDLFYRLNVIRVHVPPLRDRRGDIPALVESLLARMAGRTPPSLRPGEIERLQSYGWPGNVRELRNVLERSLVLHRDPLRPSELIPATRARPREEDEAPAQDEDLALSAVEHRHVCRVVRLHGGNLSRSARALGISLSTLKRKLDQYGLRQTNLERTGSE
jgi:DNA-binding NtrC family response regulator